MRVAIVLPRRVSGVYTGGLRISADLAFGLARRGFEVFFVIPRRGSGSCGVLRSLYDLRGVGCIELSEGFLSSILLLPFRVLTAVSREALLFLQIFVQLMLGLPRIHIPGVLGLGGFFNVVIGESLYSAPIVVLLARVSGARAILRLHNVEAEYISLLAPRILRRLAFRLVYSAENRVLRSFPGGLIVISERDRLLFRRLYGVDPYFIGPTLRASRRECPERGYIERVLEIVGVECHRYILYVGSYHKPSIGALKRLLEALEMLGGSVKIVIVGPSGLMIDRTLSKRAGAIIAGRVGEKTLRALYCCAGLSIIPTIGSGVPIKVIEALQYGIPTIAPKRIEEILPYVRSWRNLVALESLEDLEKIIKRNIEKIMRGGISVESTAEDIYRERIYREIVEKYIEYMAFPCQRDL